MDLSDAKACPAPLSARGFVAAGASLADPGVLPARFPFYSELRRERPVYFDGRLNMFLVTRYEDVQAVLADPVTFSIELGYNSAFASGHQEEFQAILRRDGGGYFRDGIMTDPPVHGRTRVASRDADIGGVPVPAGSQLLVMFASANDDEGEFACPRGFDIDRLNLGRHVGFGSGVHRCVGAALARSELKVVAQEVVRRLDDIQLDIAVGDIPLTPSATDFTIAHLPVRFTRRG